MAAWDIHMLAAAVAAQPQTARADLANLRDVLNSQTDPTPIGAIQLGSLQGELLATGDWLRILARAKQQTTGAASDAAILTAQTAEALVEGKSEGVDPQHYDGFVEQLQVLVTAGDISPAAQTAILKLAKPTDTVPRWMPPVTIGDLQTVLRDMMP